MLKNCKVDFLGNSEVAFFLIHPVDAVQIIVHGHLKLWSNANEGH
jgi:hypothetical protein